MNLPASRAMTLAAEPTGGGAARVELLDVLRGLALFGILVINLGDFTLLWTLSAEAKAALPTAALDPVADWFDTFLFEGKFYSIFSLLFGIGFALQLARGSGDAAHLARYRQRLLVLMVIGAAHMTFFWMGDILFLYATLGFVLLLFRARSDRTLLTWAAALLVLPVVMQAIIAVSGGAANPGRPFEIVAQRIDGHHGWNVATDWGAVFGVGGWRDFFAANLSGPFYRLEQFLETSRIPKVLAMFLVGLWVGRNLQLGAIEQHRALLRRVLVGGLAIGLPASALMATLSATGDEWTPTAGGVLHAAMYTLGVAPLGLAYAAGVALLYTRMSWRRRLGVFAPVGRMALTNYLMQTTIGIGLFYGVGLGLGRTVGSSLLPVLALVIFAFQTVVSRWWLSRFRFGPMEWVWRSLTYGRRQPMRRERAAVAAVAG